jgi:hypothetical protein
MQFNVISPIKHDGKRYAEGGSISLTKEEAAPLLVAGVIGADDKAAKAEAKAKADAAAAEAAEASAKADAAAAPAAG